MILLKVKNRNGSTTVVVILVMLVLLFFGLSILSTSISNMNLSNKKNEWVREYYELESLVAIELRNVDEVIITCKKEIDYDNWETVYKEKLLVYLQDYMKGSISENYMVYHEDEKVILKFDVSDVDTETIPKYIQVGLEIALPNLNISKSEFMNLQNYKIVDYRQKQEAFTYNNTIEYENPFE